MDWYHTLYIGFCLKACTTFPVLTLELQSFKSQIKDSRMIQRLSERPISSLVTLQHCERYERQNSPLIGRCFRNRQSHYHHSIPRTNQRRRSAPRRQSPLPSANQIVLYDCTSPGRPPLAQVDGTFSGKVRLQRRLWLELRQLAEFS